MGQTLEHGYRPQVPEGQLVLGVAGRQVPEGTTRVGDDGEAGGLELDEQGLKAIVLSKNSPRNSKN